MVSIRPSTPPRRFGAGEIIWGYSTTGSLKLLIPNYQGVPNANKFFIPLPALRRKQER